MLAVRVNSVVRHWSAAVPAASEGARPECRAWIRLASSGVSLTKQAGRPFFMTAVTAILLQLTRMNTGLPILVLIPPADRD